MRVAGEPKTPTRVSQIQRAGRPYLVDRNGSGGVGNDHVISIPLGLDGLDSGAWKVLTRDESAQRVALEQRRHDPEREEVRSREMMQGRTRRRERNY